MISMIGTHSRTDTGGNIKGFDFTVPRTGHTLCGGVDWGWGCMGVGVYGGGGVWGGGGGGDKVRCMERGGRIYNMLNSWTRSNSNLIFFNFFFY